MDLDFKEVNKSTILETPEHSSFIKINDSSSRVHRPSVKRTSQYIQSPKLSRRSRRGQINPFKDGRSTDKLIGSINKGMATLQQLDYKQIALSDTLNNLFHNTSRKFNENFIMYSLQNLISDINTFTGCLNTQFLLLDQEMISNFLHFPKANKHFRKVARIYQTIIVGATKQRPLTLEELGKPEFEESHRTLMEIYEEMKITLQERPHKQYLYIPIIVRWSSKVDTLVGSLILECNKNKKKPLIFSNPKLVHDIKNHFSMIFDSMRLGLNVYSLSRNNLQISQIGK